MVGGHDHLESRTADHFPAAPPVEVLGSSIPVGDAAVGVGCHYAHVDLVEQRSLCPHLFLRLPARGHVVVRDHRTRALQTGVAADPHDEPPFFGGAVARVFQRELVGAAGEHGTQPVRRPARPVIRACGVADRQVVLARPRGATSVVEGELDPGAVGHDDLAHAVDDGDVRGEPVQSGLYECARARGAPACQCALRRDPLTHVACIRLIRQSARLWIGRSPPPRPVIPAGGWLSPRSGRAGWRIRPVQRVLRASASAGCARGVSRRSGSKGRAGWRSPGS